MVNDNRRNDVQVFLITSNHGSSTTRRTTAEIRARHVGCRPAQRTSSGSAQFGAFLREKLLLPVSDESADECDVRFSNGAAMLTHSLSLSLFMPSLPCAWNMAHGCRPAPGKRECDVRFQLHRKDTSNET